MGHTRDALPAPREACGSPLRKPSLGLSIGTKECTRVYTLVYPRVHSCVHACTLPRSRYLRYGGVGEPLGQLALHSPTAPWRVRRDALTHSTDSSRGEYRDVLAHPVPLLRTRVGESLSSKHPLRGWVKVSVSYQRGGLWGGRLGTKSLEGWRGFTFLYTMETLA